MMAALKFFFIAISLLAHISPSRAETQCRGVAVNSTDCKRAQQSLPFGYNKELQQSTGLVTIERSRNCMISVGGSSQSNIIKRRDVELAALAILNGCKGMAHILLTVP
ncbi:hypothetical protein Pst134EA_025614 [Puccinia striiformis f. sp. tritici]|uniref:Secreted protein n=1 Tax=Puccinia striiformis f. sp. tritici PST-78 TaxID=1165861 RepID=A0A0L0UVP1_9BASI|nr:hypothetical protein Pst134EA_025614 [Puccinia striiformis f. sp. tritici]KAH9451670.1 hypothetical protein Pst134EA_025614 [Puccinia striiformis f. sp. tritici]KAI9613140.1 hypothetical protein H4Q26_010419 [Puccinia striiformis f. sp. tritici PST-130]KNE91113.1 hypothetical protein PSTG_15464 [Puccinia striiformis f. sp. tritici PST-78]